MKEKFSNNRNAFIVLIIYTIFLILKSVDFFMITASRGRLGVNFLYLLACITILFMITRMSESKVMVYSSENSGFLLYGIMFFLPFYFLGTALEIIYGVIRGNKVNLLFFPQNFRISSIGDTSPILSSLILIIIYYLLVVVMEESFFRGLINSVFGKIFKPFPVFFLNAFLFSLWQMVKPLKGYATDPIHSDIFLREAAVTFIIHFILSIKWDLLKEATQSIWTSTADHFMSVFLFNIFHVRTSGLMDANENIRYVFISVIPLILLLLIRYRMKKNNSSKRFLPGWSSSSPLEITEDSTVKEK